jgi:hypothetical protein
MCRWLAAASIMLLSLAGAQAAELKFSGYYKNLLLDSETIAPPGERYTLDRNRLRLELKGTLAEGAALDLQYDNEVLLGSYLQTAQFAAQKSLEPPQYWDLERSYGEGDNWYGRHRLYRASLTLSSGATDVRIGRQRIAWGTGRFWSPVDLLNPINPITLEREERVGVDAVLAERKLGALSRIAAVYAPSRESGLSSGALNWHANAAGVDYSVVAGRFSGERVGGAAIATQWAGAGVRAEYTHNAPEAAAYWRGVFALDYAFASTLTLSGELYYNGAGASEPSAYDFAALFAGRIQNVGRKYFGGYAGYEITPLLKSANFLVANLADDSRYFSPTLVFSLRPNLDLTLGAQVFSGPAGSEYGTLKDVAYAQLQWFF